MTSTTTVVSLRQPDTIDDPLTAVLRSGARRLLAQAIEAEADAFLAAMKGERLPDGRERRCCTDRLGGARDLAGVVGSSLSDPGCHLALQAECRPPPPHSQADVQNHELARL